MENRPVRFNLWASKKDRFVASGAGFVLTKAAWRFASRRTPK
jgi:hypothetical protein